MNRSGTPVWVAAILVSGLTGWMMVPAVAGPPLSIDDPDILEPGQFEVILAGTVEKGASERVWELPLVDLSFGLTPQVQLSAVASRIVLDPDDGSRKSDFGTGSIGLKWRFIEAAALQVSVAPFFETELREGAVERGVVEDVETWTLPVQGQYEFGSWRLNGELAYTAARGAMDEWAFGVAASWPVSTVLTAMVELHGAAEPGFNETAGYLRIGADIALSESWHVLGALGRGIHEPGEADTDLLGYFGIQWFP